MRLLDRMPRGLTARLRLVRRRSGRRLRAARPWLPAWLLVPASVWDERRVRALRLGARGLQGGLLALLLLAFWRARFVTPEPTFLLRDREGRFLAEVGETPGGEFGYWPLGALPPRVVAATLAVEDRRFFEHPGVDPLALFRAARQNLSTGRRISGASTLAMQVARMQAPGTRRYPRKLVEALTALGMTAFYGRDGVLNQYLRLVPYGNRIHGIGYAARRYLDKPVEDLSWAEVAFLTAIPQSPARMNPFDGDGRARAVRRGRRILDLLLKGGQLDANEHQLACQQIETLQVPVPGTRPAPMLHAVLRLQELLRDPQVRDARATRPVVVTTLDLDVQRTVAELTSSALAEWQGQGAGNAAVLVVERGTSAVRAWVGSSDYFDSSRAGAIDYARVPRSPGSTLKPFFYALALERGALTPATLLDDLGRGPGDIGNADGEFLGPLLPRVALANSRNVPAAFVLQSVGLDEGYAFLRDLGLHEGEVPARRYGLGLTIGGMPVTLERLVRAYGALASDGLLQDLLWFEGQPSAPPRRVLSEDVARQIALYLSDPQARQPSFARLGALEYPFPVAVKTGTSSRYRDAWTVAFSSRYLVGVWVGDPDFRPMDRLTGYRSAAELTQRVLLRLHPDEADGLRDVPFPAPRGQHQVRLCALSGQRATPYCERVFGEWLRTGDEPREECSFHVPLGIDTRSGALATRATPRGFVEVRTFVELPPRYASWAAQAGLTPPPRLEGTSASPLDLAPEVRLTITSPQDGLRLLHDPETPADRSTVGLNAVVSPPVPQLVWYVDGQPFSVVDYPYSARWPLQPGEHVIQARLPRAPVRSVPVRVLVQ